MYLIYGLLLIRSCLILKFGMTTTNVRKSEIFYDAFYCVQVNFHPFVSLNVLFFYLLRSIFGWTGTGVPCVRRPDAGWAFKRRLKMRWHKPEILVFWINFGPAQQLKKDINYEQKKHKIVISQKNVLCHAHTHTLT